MTTAGGRANPSVLMDIAMLDALVGISTVMVAHHTGEVFAKHSK